MGRTVIRSQHQLSYQQAQDVLDGREPPRTTTGPALGAAATERIRAGVGFLRAVARRLHKKRAAAGALELASAEIHFSCDARTGLPTRTSPGQNPRCVAEGRPLHRMRSSELGT